MVGSSIVSSFYLILIAIFGLSLLVIVHEYGHYLAARAFGMRVTRFSIGIGPTLARFQPKGSPTVFQVGAIPLMAYVQIAGMNPAEEYEADDPELFPNKSAFARIVTVFAGPLANYLAASLMVFGISTTVGWRTGTTGVEPMTVANVMPGSPANKAGLQPGDVIAEANGTAVKNVEELIAQTESRAGQETTYLVRRGDEAPFTVAVTPELREGRGMIGVVAKTDFVFEVLSPSDALRNAVMLPAEMTVLNLTGIADMVQQQTTEHLKGPIGMTKIMMSQAEQGPFDFAWALIAVSVALGLFNLLPIPGLDGGRLMFLAYEVITRRRPNEQIEQMIHAAGIIFLLGVIVLVSFRDAVN